jgi:hypothetical protein
MGRRACAILLVGVVALGWTTTDDAAAQEASGCQVGATPADPETFMKPTAEYLVIGCGEAFGRPVEISAFTSKLGLCVGLRARKTGWQQCPAQTPPLSGGPAAIQTWQFGYDFWRVTQVTGPLRPDVARITVRFRRKGRTRRSEGVVAQADAELAARIGHPEPFGYFAAFAPGCAHPSHIEATSFDAAGAVLGVVRGHRRACYVGPGDLPSHPPASPPG